jgi:hypothetical protein
MCRAQALAGIRSSADSQVELARSCRSAPTPGCDVHCQPDSGHGVLRPFVRGLHASTRELQWIVGAHSLAFVLAVGGGESKKWNRSESRVADLRTALDFVATTPLAFARRIAGQP